MNDWRNRAVIYEINWRAMAARDPRNVFEALQPPSPATDTRLSPIAYVRRHLKLLRTLGVNTLHFMPPFRMSLRGRKGIGSPYAVRDFRAIDPEFGTMSEFRSLIRHAHRLGFHVLLGMVPNHTGLDHHWITRHPDYYVHTPSGRIHYDFDWHDTAKLDYSNPRLRRAMRAILTFWLNPSPGNPGRTSDGVDGFRMDMAHFISDLSFWDETIPLLRRRCRQPILFMAECYGSRARRDLLKRGFDAVYDDRLYKIFELFYGIDRDGRSILLPSSRAAARPEWKAAFSLYRRGGIAALIRDHLDQSLAFLQRQSAQCRLVRYTENHDEGRAPYRFGPEAARVLSALIFLAPGSLPYILCGQEFGALNRPSIHDRIRPCEKGRRIKTPRRVAWQDGVEFEGNIFARDPAQRRDLFAFYNALITLHRRFPQLSNAGYQPLDPAEDAPPGRRSILAFTRTLARHRLNCILNLGDQPRRIGAGNILSGKPLIGEPPADGILPPFSALVLLDPH